MKRKPKIYDEVYHMYHNVVKVSTVTMVTTGITDKVDRYIIERKDADAVYVTVTVYNEELDNKLRIDLSQVYATKKELIDSL